MADLERHGAVGPPQLTNGQRIWRRLHDVRERVLPAPKLGPAWAPMATGQAAGDLIYDLLSSGAPAMVARFGAGELEAVLRQRAIRARRPRMSPLVRYLFGRAPAPWWDAAFLDAMELHTGFYPATPANLARFADRMLADIALVDILGSWLPGERDLASHGLRAMRVPLVDLEPYVHEAPWSRVLRGRTVLVVHPIAEQIRRQLERRSLLFPNRDVLPPFDLRTVTAVVSNAGARPPFPDWFAALDAMTEAIARESFDIAIIGAGAYGLPLAAAVKRMGRQAVHLGGSAQVLFGIRGKRWDDMPSIRRFFNDAWVYPAPENRPPRWRDVEGGCYW